MFVFSGHDLGNIYSSCKYFLNHPKVQRVKLLAGTFLFSVVLLAADIITDLATSFDFFTRGNFFWGMFTLIPICAPFLAKITLYLVLLTRCFRVERSKLSIFGKVKIDKIEVLKARLSFWFQELKLLPWHFPLILPLR
jgi:hypothetical protein